MGRGGLPVQGRQSRRASPGEVFFRESLGPGRLASTRPDWDDWDSTEAEQRRHVGRGLLLRLRPRHTLRADRPEGVPPAPSIPRHMHTTPSRIRPFHRRVLLFLALASIQGPALAAQSSPDPTPFDPGKSTVRVDVDGTPLNLWVYKPDNYVGDGFILLFHGASRAAEAYRDNAAFFADRYGRLVVVPEFDAERFPSRTYQFGGVFREDGSFADADERTFAYVPKLVDRIREAEGKPDLPYILLGYSAGAQFLERLAAFMDTDAERLVAMSPGSSMFPTRDLEYGLGFGGLPEEFGSDERLRRYLALPLTIAIGSADVENAQLPRGDAYDQGVHRYSRNLRWFVTAMDMAHERGWDFNWRLVIHHGAGHPPPEMFHHPQIGNSLFGHRTMHRGG